MKDPAFLFYYQDFIFGTSFMTNEQVGAYIKVLCFLADKGKIPESHVKTICGSQEVFNAVIEKLERNGDDSYHQKRLSIEKEKRAKHIEHQRENANKRWNKCDGNAMALPLEDENENEDVNEIKNKEKEQEFKSEVYEFLKLYPDAMLKEFINYWTEPNLSKTKLKFELEKTWDLNKRLARWANNSKDFKKAAKPVYNEKPVYRSTNFDKYLEDMPDNVKKLAEQKTVKL